jgi:hypothetical protein
VFHRTRPPDPVSGSCRGGGAPRNPPLAPRLPRERGRGHAAGSEPQQKHTSGRQPSLEICRRATGTFPLAGPGPESVAGNRHAPPQGAPAGSHQSYGGFNPGVTTLRWRPTTTLKWWVPQRGHRVRSGGANGLRGGHTALLRSSSGVRDPDRHRRPCRAQRIASTHRTDGSQTLGPFFFFLAT